jgi:predicted DNA-binding transcriptional regulator AlpA
MTKPDTPTLVFIALARVMEMSGRSKSAIYEDPSFPLPVSFSEPGRARRHARWLLHEVEAWLQERIAERDAKAVQRRQHLLAQRELRLIKRRTTPKRSVDAEADA